jgi:Protein of unknown function (DUF4232)
MDLSSTGAAVKISAVGAVAIVALSACQRGSAGATSSGAPATGPQPSQSVVTNGPVTGGAAPTAAAPAGRPSGDTPRCTAADLSAEIVDQGSIAGPRTASWMLLVTNTSGRACALNGYPSFGLEDGSGSLWSDSRTRYVQHPGGPTRIGLKPGMAAFAGVKWALCGTGDLVGGLVMTPPGDTAHVKVTVTTDRESARQTLFRLCDHSVTAGTLQPSRQGVVFAS